MHLDLWDIRAHRRDPEVLLFHGRTLRFQQSVYWPGPLGCGLEDGHYDLPISTPVMNTSAPPSPTCRAAENVGVSMYRCRTQVMTPSSTRTTAIAIPRANGKSLIRNGRVWPMPPSVVIAPQIRPRTQGCPRPV